MGERVVLETPCDHGQFICTEVLNPDDLFHLARMCPGGSRRVLEPAQPNYNAVAQILLERDGPVDAPLGSYLSDARFVESARELVDAALEGLRLVKETD